MASLSCLSRPLASRSILTAVTCWREVVVKFAGDSAALFVLNLEQSAGEFLEFHGAELDDAARFVELLDASAEFAIESLETLFGFAAGR